MDLNFDTKVSAKFNLTVTHRLICFPFFEFGLQSVLNAAAAPLVSAMKSEHISRKHHALAVCSGENSISGCAFSRFVAFAGPRHLADSERRVANVDVVFALPTQSR